MKLAKKSKKEIETLAKELEALVGTENVALKFNPTRQDFIDAHNDAEVLNGRGGLIFNYGHGANNAPEMIFSDRSRIKASDILYNQDEQGIVMNRNIHSKNYMCHQEKFKDEWSLKLPNAEFYFDKGIRENEALPLFLEHLKNEIAIMRYHYEK